MWNDALTKSRDNEIFLTWEWLSTWWKHYGKERKLNILIGKNGRKLRGMAPLMLSKCNILGFCKLTKIEFIGTPESDYNAFILIKDEIKCLKLFLDYLINDRSNWDLLELRDVSEITLSAKILRKLVNKGKMKESITDLCPYIKIFSSMDIMMKRLSRNMRRNLKKRMRKLKKEYRVEIKTHNSFSSVEEAMKIFFDLHQKRWESKGQPGAFSQKVFHDFHLELAKNFIEKNWLSLYFLTVNDKPIASVYSFDYKQKKYGYLTGFDPLYREFSPGNLLKMYVIEECVKKGLKEYDLMRGYEAYKGGWATKVRKNLEVQLINKGLSARIYDFAKQNLLMAKTNYYYLAGKHGYAITLAKRLGLT